LNCLLTVMSSQLCEKWKIGSAKFRLQKVLHYLLYSANKTDPF
jgi:hypothetical protein